jgi:hypothetical protein
MNGAIARARGGFGPQARIKTVEVSGLFEPGRGKLRGRHHIPLNLRTLRKETDERTRIGP